MNERKARALIEQHFTETLPPAKFEQLWAHVGSCAGCKAHYDHLFAFEARLDGGKAEAERIGLSLFDKLSPAHRQGFFAALMAGWSLPRLAAIATLAGLVLLVLVAPQLRGRDDFAERGGVAFGPELLATCFRDVGGKLEDVRAIDGRSTQACPRGGRLALAYRNARQGDQLAVFAQRGQEVTSLVSPAGLEKGPQKRALSGSFAIDADAPEGEVKLVAVFGKTLDATRLERALKVGEDPQVEAGKDSVVRTLAYRLDKP
jgi:hypothetical protein